VGLEESLHEISYAAPPSWARTVEGYHRAPSLGGGHPVPVEVLGDRREGQALRSKNPHLRPRGRVEGCRPIEPGTGSALDRKPLSCTHGAPRLV
jgi:hypothetical protein